MQAGFVGCGYVGLVAAACLVAVGHRVVAVEVDPDRLARLRDGRVPFHEPGLEGLVREGLCSGRLVFSGDLRDVVGAGVVFVAVPTPDDPADPGHGALAEVADRLVALIERPTVVAIKSTVTPAVVDALIGRFAGSPATIVVNPEFLREGHAVEDFRRPARWVLGGPAEAVDQLVALYRPLYGDLPVVRTDPRSAALAKLAANGMLAVRVSFANELARVAAALGADVGAVLDVVGLDPRIGRSHLSPSIGYGGACLPKDTRLLAAVGRGVGSPLRVVEAADRANGEQRDGVIAAVRAALGGLEGRRIAVWGLAFKAGTDDVRASASVAVVGTLREGGAEVVVHDPQVADGDPVGVVEGVDALIVGTAWPLYGTVDPVVLRPRGKRVFDVGRVLDGRWPAAGWTVWAG